MPQDEPKPPKPEPSDRETRLAKALRDNLRRRKATAPAQPKPKSDA